MNAYKNLYLFRLDGDTQISKKQFKSLCTELNVEGEISEWTAKTEMISGRKFICQLHICSYIRKGSEKVWLHLLYYIDRLKRGDMVKPEDKVKFDEVDEIISASDLSFKTNCRIIFSFDVKPNENIFGLPRVEKVGGLSLRFEGTIFRAEMPPKDSYLLESTGRGITIAKQFKIRKFVYNRQTAGDIMAANLDDVSRFLKRG